MKSNITENTIKQFRKDNNLLQKELASMLGISSASLSLYEAGKQPVSRLVELALQTIMSEPIEKKVSLLPNANKIKRGDDILIDVVVDASKLKQYKGFSFMYLPFGEYKYSIRLNNTTTKYYVTGYYDSFESWQKDSDIIMGRTVKTQ